MDKFRAEIRRMEERYRELVEARGWTPASAQRPQPLRSLEDVGVGRRERSASWRRLADIRHSTEFTVLQNLQLLAQLHQEQPGRDDIREDLLASLASFEATAARLQSGFETPLEGLARGHSLAVLFPAEWRQAKRNAETLRRVARTTRSSIRPSSILEAVAGLVRALDDIRDALESQRLVLNTLVEDVVKLHRRLLEQQKIELEYTPPTGPQLHLFGDGVLIRDAIGELIANAARHGFTGDTRWGRKLVSVSLSSALKDGRSFATIAVGDNGNGLAAGMGDRLWQSGASGSGGSGHGLAMVRRIAQAHGGDAEAQSKPGSGTQVRFTLELA